MKYTLRRLVLSVVTTPIVLVMYGGLYFGLALLANSYASIGLFLSNLIAVAFGWIVAVTFSRQIFDFIERTGN
jgi:hypothetical protein